MELFLSLMLLGREVPPVLLLERVARFFMSYVDAVPPPDEPGAVRRVSWTSSTALMSFVWAVHLCAGMGSGSRAGGSRAAMAVWARKLKVSAVESEDGAPTIKQC